MSSEETSDHSRDSSNRFDDEETQPQRRSVTRNNSAWSQPCLRKAPSTRGDRRNISWNETVKTRVFQKLPYSTIQRLFYDRQQLAQFRQDAFLESCGLDPDEFQDMP
jgi:hypothetical protein